MRRLILRAVLVCLLLVGVVSLYGGEKAAALSHHFPEVSGSGCDYNPCDTPVLANIGEVEFAQGSELHLKAYFTTPNGNVHFYRANWCPAGSGNPDTLEPNSHYGQNPGQLVTGRNTTAYSYTTGGTTTTIYGVYRLSTSSSCDTAFNVGLTNMTYEASTDLYYATIDVAHVPWPGGTCTLAVPAGCDGIMNTFSVGISGSSSYALVAAGDSKVTPKGHQATLIQNKLITTPATLDYIVRFGSDCSVVDGTTPYNLSYYDMDNAPGSTVQPDPTTPRITMDLYDETANAVVLSSWQPPDNPRATETKSFVPQPGHKYRWTIHDVYYLNTVQYGTPFDQIYYLKQCTTSPPPATPPDAASDDLPADFSNFWR